MSTDSIRVPQYQLKLWQALTDDAKQAAVDEHASVTFVILAALATHLSDALMVAEADDVADDKWEQERKP
jgi:hypothetical protein